MKRNSVFCSLEQKVSKIREPINRVFLGLYVYFKTFSRRVEIFEDLKAV